MEQIRTFFYSERPFVRNSAPYAARFEKWRICAILILTSSSSFCPRGMNKRKLIQEGGCPHYDGCGLFSSAHKGMGYEWGISGGVPSLFHQQCCLTKAWPVNTSFGEVTVTEGKRLG
ncbi:hypothetical protein CEXT_352581 [Caerostris extrusa]|uniref:Uncharacterized protein n=1 Tax=Caerostris extrusa TaxID=172846 RepID=A0AAV4NUP9_CAEEX|nr:hypothetical protein CEXT_352581 [Caerostris extrusa]